MPHVGVGMKRLAGVLAAVILLAAVARFAMTSTPVTGYAVLDDYNIALRIAGNQAQWRGIDVTESASQVAVDLKEIWIHGPGFDDAIAYVTVRLRDPLGSRAIVDASSGAAIPAIAPAP